ncbi:MAG: BamA/TamA family outer membrane protein [candidate division WOR-3 bacterium]
MSIWSYGDGQSGEELQGNFKTLLQGDRIKKVVLIIFLSTFFISIFSEKIKNIKIEGNLYFSEEKIKKVMKLKVGGNIDKITFNERKNLLISFYRSNGFLDVDIEKYEMVVVSDKADIYIKLNEGFLTLISDVKVYGNKVLESSEILSILDLKKNSPLDIGKIYQKQISIIDRYASLGFIYASVDYELVPQENRYRVALYVNVEEGEKTYIKDIYFDSSSFRTTKKIFEMETQHYKRKEYIPEEMYYLQRKIYSSNLFNSLNFKIEGIEEKKESLKVFFYGEEKKKNWISSAMLYQFPNKFKISTGIGNDNLFNNSEKLSLESSAASSFVNDPFMMYDKWFYSILRYKVPYLFSTFYSFNSQIGFNIESNPFYLKKDFVFNTGISRIFGQYSFSNNWSYRISTIDTFSEDRSYRYEKVTTNSTNIIFYFDSRDEFIFPTRGVYSMVKFELAGGLLKGYNNFYRFVYENSNYYGYKEQFVNMFRIRIGVILPYGISYDRGISINEQFTLGGLTSVRGVQQDSIGPLNDLGTRSGNFLINLNYELRVKAYKSFGIIYFFDTGMLKKYFDFNFNIKDFVLSGGIGIFYNTVFGTLRFDVAKPFNVAEDMKYYFSLGNPF